LRELEVLKVRVLQAVTDQAGAVVVEAGEEAMTTMATMIHHRRTLPTSLPQESPVMARPLSKIGALVSGLVL
jgi:hypothetical protein